MNAFKCPNCGKIAGGNVMFCIDCGETCRFMFDYKFYPSYGNQMKYEHDTK